MRPATLFSIALATATLASPSARAQTVWRVDDDAPPGGDGTTWTTAFDDLQLALDAAQPGHEIWVAAGTYVPDARTDPTDPRTATFHLMNGLAVYGGFAGDEGDLRERAPDLYQSILTGDISRDDTVLEFPSYLFSRDRTGGTRDENSYHVVTAVDVDRTAVLDGFVITGGVNNVGRMGGGMYNAFGSPTIRHCTFTWNGASSGGGLYNLGGSPEISDCTFASNVVRGRGGGVYNLDGNPTLINCLFIENIAHSFSRRSGGSGGGMASDGGSPTLINCTFSTNSAQLWGGGLYLAESDAATLMNCVFVWHERTAVVIWRGVRPTFTNCTFTANRGKLGGAVRSVLADGTIFTNCVLWGNFPDDPFGPQISSFDGTPTVSHSCIQGGWDGPGTGNITNDPLFRRVDFQDPTTSDFRVAAGSPCINAGDNTALPTDSVDLDGDGNTIERLPIDLDGNARVQNCVVDMGAFEFGSADVPADADCDGDVDLGDYVAFGACFGGPDVPHEPGCNVFDLDGDGDVDLADLLIVQAAFTGAQ